MGLFKNKTFCPIGIDLGSGYLRMAQIAMNGEGPYLHAAGLEAKPAEIEAGSANWQRWGVDAISSLLKKGNFKGKRIVTALPSDDLFIDQVRIAKSQVEKVEETAYPKVQKKLPFSKEQAVIKYVVAEHPDSRSSEVEVLILATDRVQVDRHLAIYEKAGCELYGMNVWPFSMINSYRGFFCRRQNEQDRVAILLDIGTNHCNVVICRGSQLLFARVISIGFKQLAEGNDVERLISEVDACCRYYENIPGAREIQRLVFLAGTGVERTVCEKVAELAQRMQIAAQIGDVLCAVKIDPKQDYIINRRNSSVDWAMAFGLSLDGMPNQD